MIIDGLVEVKDPGVYTFYFRAQDDGSLKIGDRVIFALGHSNPMIGVPHARTVALERGLYSLSIEQNNPLKKKYETLELEWEGPGIKRQAIPSANLFHRK